MLVNAYNEGKKYILKLLQNGEDYFQHLNHEPYYLNGQNKICPFCTDMIERQINAGKKRGYPVNEKNPRMTMADFSLVSTNIHPDLITHQVSILN